MKKNALISDLVDIDKRIFHRVTTHKNNLTADGKLSFKCYNFLNDRFYIFQASSKTVYKEKHLFLVLYGSFLENELQLQFCFLLNKKYNNTANKNSLN